MPEKVKNGFSALGAAIINPFDGIILDVLAATALVATIIYYWDDIKGLWEDIKTVFRNFAGMDAAVEILDNIEAGVDEAGKGEEDGIAVQLGDIASQYGNLQCVEAVTAMEDMLKKKGKKYEVVSMQYSNRGSVLCISQGEKEISQNGYHVGVLYEGMVHCNVHPYGVLLSTWLNDFIGGGFGVVTPPEYQSLKVRHNG